MSIGIDLVPTDEVRESLQSHGDRYMARVYTDREQGACGRDPRRLAACLAAKEATMKALGVAGEPVPWRAIDVRLAPERVELSGPAADLAQRRGIGGLCLSVTYHRATAAAVVVAEAETR